MSSVHWLIVYATSKRLVPGKAMVEMVGKVVVFWGGAFGAEKRCRLGCHDAPKTIKNKGLGHLKTRFFTINTI